MGRMFHIFSSPQPEIANFWNTAAFFNIAPVQLYSWIYIVETKGLRGKMVIDPIAILAIGKVWDPCHPKMCGIFHDYR